LDFLEGGPGHLQIRRLLEEAHREVFPLLMSVVNFGEVFYQLFQQRGEEAARQVIASITRLPIQLTDVDLEQSLKAGEIKARHKIPYVDCLAAALAAMRDAVLVTSDRDFEKLGRKAKVLWIARP
jgi:predicted nucleic acid-binding protein